MDSWKVLFLYALVYLSLEFKRFSTTKVLYSWWLKDRIITSYIGTENVFLSSKSWWYIFEIQNNRRYLMHRPALLLHIAPKAFYANTSKKFFILSSLKFCCTQKTFHLFSHFLVLVKRMMMRGEYSTSMILYA